MASKEQERKALAQIKGIIEGLGEDSYVAAAFKGCCEAAKNNIDNEWACSVLDRAIRADNQVCAIKMHLANVEAERDRAMGKVKELEAKLDKEQGWHDCKGGTKMAQKDYEMLRYHMGGSRDLTEEQAKNILNFDFGFAPDKVELLYDVSTYEVNRRGIKRVKKVYRRVPVTDSASREYYIFFAAAGRVYEAIDGELYLYEC